MTSLLLRLLIPDYENTRSPEVRSRYGILAGGTGILCNLLLCIMKMTAGILSGSVAITADAVNNLSDASSNIVSLLGFRLAKKPADAEHPYGHGRYEYLAGLFVCVLILVIGLELLKSSVEKIMHPADVIFSWLSCVVLLVSIAVKLWMMLFQNKLGRMIDSQTLTATAADSRNDVITTAAVLLASLLSRYISPIELDGYIGVGVALFILYNGVGLIRSTVDPLLGTAPAPEYVNAIREKILSYPGVLGTHDLLIHDYGPGRQFASVHVEMAAEQDVLCSHEIIDSMERDFLREENLHMIIHYDPVVTANEALDQFRPWLAETVRQIHPDLTVHDIHIINGPSAVIVSFDCCVPAGEYEGRHDVLIETINALVQETYPDYQCVITIDTGYAPVQK